MKAKYIANVKVNTEAWMVFCLFCSKMPYQNICNYCSRTPAPFQSSGVLSYINTWEFDLIPRKVNMNTILLILQLIERTINQIQVAFNLWLLIYGWFKITPWYQPLCSSSSHILYIFFIKSIFGAKGSGDTKFTYTDPLGSTCDSYSQSSTPFFIYACDAWDTHKKGGASSSRHIFHFDASGSGPGNADKVRTFPASDIHSD